jgi:hypothetical protein
LIREHHVGHGVDVRRNDAVRTASYEHAPRTRERVLTLAELFDDTIENGIDVYTTVEAVSTFRTPMDDYAAVIIATSPAIVLVIADRPG